MLENTTTLDRWFAQIEPLIESGQLVRRWSYEAEHEGIAKARRSANWSDTRQFDFVIDGSVECDFDYCECSCRDCNFHECNCDNCEDYNDSPDHCNDSDCTSNEFAPRVPTDTAFNKEQVPFLEVCADELTGTYWDSVDFSRLGGHLHVEARDLTRAQIRNAVIIADHMFKIMPEWFTGTDDEYNNPISGAELVDWVAGTRHTERSRIISVYNLGRYHTPRPYEIGDRFDYEKSTIEFRRFRTTFDWRVLALRGAVCRAIIEYAKANHPLYYAIRHREADGLLQEIEFGKH